MFSFAENYLTRGFWGDEAWTSLISQLPFSQMLKTTAADFHPPGYYSVVEFVYLFLPPTEIATRSISIFFYFLTVFMAYKLASEIKGRTFGILSAILVMVNPIFFRYAFEARNYTMFAFCATASIYFLIRLSENFNWKRSIPFILFSTLGIYTHYFMFFVLAAQGLYLLFADRKIFLRMMFVYFAVGVLYLGWIPFLLSQLKSVSGDYWISGIDWKHTHLDALRRILGGEEDNFYQLFLFRFSALLVLAGLIQHLRKKSFEKPYILIWLWAIVPFVLATLPGLQIDGIKLPFRSVFFWRYLIPAAVPLSMLIVHTSQKLPKGLSAVSIAVVITLSAYINLNTFFTYHTNFKQVYSEKIVPQISQSSKIVTVLPSFAEVLYYKNNNNLENELIVLPEGLVQFSGKSLLDAYVENGTVMIGDAPENNYFDLRPGPIVVVSD